MIGESSPAHAKEYESGVRAHMKDSAQEGWNAMDAWLHGRTD